MVWESDIILRDVSGNTGRKTAQTGRRAEIYQNRETSGSTGDFTGLLSNFFFKKRTNIEKYLQEKQQHTETKAKF